MIQGGPVSGRRRLHAGDARIRYPSSLP